VVNKDLGFVILNGNDDYWEKMDGGTEANRDVISVNMTGGINSTPKNSFYR
jgi:hypothetical protein